MRQPVAEIGQQIRPYDVLPVVAGTGAGMGLVQKSKNQILFDQAVLLKTLIRIDGTKLEHQSYFDEGLSSCGIGQNKEIELLLIE